MTWFAFENDGHIYDLNGAAEKAMVATFSHGYATMQEACQHRNKANPFQQQLLFNFMTEAISPVGAGSTGVIQIVEVNANCQQTGIVGPLSNPLTQGLTDSLFAPFKNANLWQRVAEFAVGAMVFFIGLKGIVSPQNANVASQTLKQTARYAAKRAKGLPIPEVKAASKAAKVASKGKA